MLHECLLYTVGVTCVIAVLSAWMVFALFLYLAGAIHCVYTADSQPLISVQGGGTYSLYTADTEYIDAVHSRPQYLYTAGAHACSLCTP